MMTSFREEVMHTASGRVYNPAARRERYLRERKLLGRTPAQTAPANFTTNQQSFIQPRNPNNKEHPKSTPVTPERVAALKIRLAQLKEVLAKLVEQAKIDAGVEPTTKEDVKKSAETKKPEDKTTAEKKKNAEAAKKQRDKEPPKPETTSSVQAQIKSVRNQIEDMRAKLAAARKATSIKKPPPAPNQKIGPEKDKKPLTKQPTAPEGRHH